jgi:quercetin dioxygenase-like cupin family protein
MEVRRLWLLSAMAKLARGQDLDSVSLLKLAGGAAESQWDRYLTTLDEATLIAAGRVISACEARIKGGRVARMREGVRAQLAADDEEARLTRAWFVRVLATGPQTVLSLWELPPGELGNPYHHRLGQMQLVLLLDGRPILRTREARRELKKGEAVVLSGEDDDGHELINDTLDRVRFLALSTGDQASLAI